MSTAESGRHDRVVLAIDLGTGGPKTSYVSLAGEVIDIAGLKRAGVVPQQAKRAKVIASGKLEQAVRLRGIAVTPGARKAIEAAGGTIEA